MLRNLDDARTFLRVIELGSFSAAARVLNLTPATVSKQITRLESALGVRLFGRSTRQVVLTEAGHATAAQLQQALAHIAQAEDLAKREHGQLQGHLHIAAPSTFALPHLARACADFHALHPQVRLDVTLSDQTIDLLKHGVDVAIRIGQPADSSLIAKPLAQSYQIVVAAPTYLADCPAPMQPQDLAAHRALVFGYPGNRADIWALQRHGESQQIQMQAALCSDHGELLRLWCINGLGLALREYWNVADDLAAGRLQQVLPEWTTQPVPICAIRPARAHTPKRVQAFIAFLAARWRSGVVS